MVGSLICLGLSNVNSLSSKKGWWAMTGVMMPKIAIISGTRFLFISDSNLFLFNISCNLSMINIRFIPDQYRILSISSLESAAKATVLDNRIIN